MMFTIGHNTPGYLSDSCEDGPVFETFDEAKRALISEMLYHADTAADEWATDISNAAEDVNLWSGPDDVLVYDPTREHDLGTVYWIMIAEED